MSRAAEEAIADPAWRQTGELSLSGLRLKTLPELPPEATERLRELDLSGNRLTTLPDWLWRLERLERLDLANNRLETLDGGIGRLGRLRELDVSENRLTRLPPELGRCKCLRRLYLFGNGIEDLGAVAELPGLVVLDAASNRVKTIEHLPSAETLAVLDLRDNALETLPPAFGSLRALRRVDLSGNRLTSSALAPLERLPLEELYVDDNLLEAPPAETHSLRRLSALGNPFGELPAARWGIGDAASAAVGRYVSGHPDPERRYFDSPTYSFDFSLAIGGRAETRRVVDLYYKGFRGTPATMDLGDGTTLMLSDVSRRTALDLVERHHGAGDAARLQIGQTKQETTLRSGTGLVAQAVARLGEAELVPTVPGAESVRFAQEAAARVLNVALTDASHTPVVDGALRPETAYLVRLDIGARSPESVVANPSPVPTPELEPSLPGGWWFDVVVASSDVDVEPDAHRLFLPFAGPSWVCDCPGPDHVCTAAKRDRHLYVRIRTRGRAERASLRCVLYHRNNAVQSLRVDFGVGGGRGAIRGVMEDYSLAEDAGGAAALAARELNVLTNEAPGGTHTIVLKDRERVIRVDLAEAQASTVLTELRGKLRQIALGGDGKSPQFDGENRKETAAFIEDLGALGRLGAVLWSAVVPDSDDRRYLRERLAERATIQVSRVTKVVFPWALVYDIPRELDADWKPCPLLEDWDGRRARLEAYPAACPFADEHGLNVLCPYGFWGFRHLLEQPPSIKRGVLRTEIGLPPDARAVAARSTALDAELTAAHFEELGRCLQDRFVIEACESKDEVREALGRALPLVYFYCHGKTALLAKTNLPVPFLEIGREDRIGPTDFGAWEEAGEWPAGHWDEVAPLVFLNGCETARLAPEDVVSFVDAFAGIHASGVIGTEIPVTQEIAGEVALRFYRRFAGPAPETVGDALYRTRIDLLAKGNVSGLVYTPFCSMDLALDGAAARLSTNAEDRHA